MRPTSYQRRARLSAEWDDPSGRSKSERPAQLSTAQLHACIIQVSTTTRSAYDCLSPSERAPSYRAEAEEERTMLVAVTGANGFLGSYTVAALRRAGHHVRALELPQARRDHVAAFVDERRIGEPHPPNKHERKCLNRGVAGRKKLTRTDLLQTEWAEHARWRLRDSPRSAPRCLEQFGTTAVCKCSCAIRLVDHSTSSTTDIIL